MLEWKSAEKEKGEGAQTARENGMTYTYWKQGEGARVELYGINKSVEYYVKPRKGYDVMEEAKDLAEITAFYGGKKEYKENLSKLFQIMTEFDERRLKDTGRESNDGAQKEGFIKKKEKTVTAKDLVGKDAKWSEFVGDDGKRYILEINREEYQGRVREDFDNLFTWATKEKAGYSDYNIVMKRKWRPEDLEDEDGKIDTTDKVIFKLGLYRHSGDYVYLGGGTHQGENFDSGTMGVAFVEKADVMKTYGWSEIGEKEMRVLQDVLEGEIKTINAVNEGDVYAIDIIDFDTEENNSSINHICVDNGNLWDDAQMRMEEYVQDAAKREKIIEKALGPDERKIKPMECVKYENKKSAETELLVFYNFDRKNFPGKGESELGLDSLHVSKHRIKNASEGSAQFILNVSENYGKPDCREHYWYFKENFTGKSAENFVKQWNAAKDMRIGLSEERKEAAQTETEKKGMKR